MLKIAIIGCGYWGRHILRILARMPDVHLRYFCDPDAANLAYLKPNYGYVNATHDLDLVLKDVAIDACVIATPVATHFDIAHKCLQAGKHVMVEQPIALSLSQANRLLDIATGRNLTLCVDHIDEYNEVYGHVREMIDRGDLGRLRYMYAQRLNLGESTSSAGVLTELGAHELYTAVNILGLRPRRIAAKGLKLMSPGAEDVAFATVDFENGSTFHIHTSWVDPNKVRKLTIVGEDKMVICDDTDPSAKLMIYHTSASARHTPDGKHASQDSYGEFQLAIRSGDVVIPHLRPAEPLQVLCDDFVSSVHESRPPRSDGYRARRVVCLLELARQSMQADGAPINVKEWI